MSGRIDAATLLERALANDARGAAVKLAIGASRSTRWASATFAGARHRLEIAMEGAAARAWLAGLGEAELPIRGHLVADLVVEDERYDGDRAVVTINALTVEAG